MVETQDGKNDMLHVHEANKHPVAPVSSKLRILWVTSAIIDVGLYNEALLNLLKELWRRGHHVSLIAVRSRHQTETRDLHGSLISVPLRYMPYLSTFMLTLTLCLAIPVYIMQLKPDFVIFMPDATVLSSIPGIIIRKARKMKFVLDIRSTPVETVGFHGFVEIFWFSLSMAIARRMFDGITIITKEMRDEVSGEFGVDPRRVEIFPSGVSTKLFNPKEYCLSGKRLKKKLGLSEKFVIFYHGGFSPNRGLFETVEAVRILRTKYPSIVLFLLGSGPATPLLETLVRENSLQENVFFHHPVDHAKVPVFIEMSDVCISPLPNHRYWRFQCPLKLLEYLAMEKVVIATDIPAHRSVAGAQKCCIYASSAEPAELAKSIAVAYANKSELAEWGKIGRLIVEERYTWERVATDLERYLWSILTDQNTIFHSCARAKYTWKESPRISGITEHVSKIGEVENVGS
jgi:glycosyltransferase involved in cell wall biosynthesis